MKARKTSMAWYLSNSKIYPATCPISIVQQLGVCISCKNVLHSHSAVLPAPIHREFLHLLNSGANEGKGLIHTFHSQMLSNVPNNSCFVELTHTHIQQTSSPLRFTFFHLQSHSHSQYAKAKVAICKPSQTLDKQKTMLFEEQVSTPT